MKILFYILMLLYVGSNYGNAQGISSDDKLHFGAGALISATTYTVVYTTTKNKKKAFWISLGTAITIGLVKEIYDNGKETNKFDTGELAATSLGGLTASYTLNIFIGKQKRKQNTALVN